MTDPGMASAPFAAPSSDARTNSCGPSGLGALPTTAEFARSNGCPIPGDPRRYNVLIAAFFLPAGLLKGIAQHAREQRWRLSSDMVHTGVMPTRWRGDGIITFIGPSSDPTSCVEDLRVPQATLSLCADCVAEPRVQPDDFAIGCLAARHLLERNCREYVWAPFSDDAANSERLRGFRSVLQARGCDCDILPPPHRRIGQAWHDNWNEWRQAASARLRASRGSAGLFAFNDCLSAEVVRLAQDIGIVVPGELAILGVGNDPLDCESGPVALSSIDPDLEGMGARAAVMLQELLERGTCNQKVVTHPPRGVITRDSTGMDRLESTRIHQAVAYVAAHIADPRLCVSSVAERIGISRRQLERDFRNLKDCTIRQFIEDIRMQQAARLVIEHPDAKILTIAENVGICDPGRFYRKFRSKFGITPAAFRRQFSPPAGTTCLSRRAS